MADARPSMSADRWPNLYDGVVAYYPAWSLTAMLTNYTSISKTLAAPGAWSNPAKQGLLKSSVVAACDALDGVTDGVVSHVAACTFAPQSLHCPCGMDTGVTCLSDALGIRLLHRRVLRPLLHPWRSELRLCAVAGKVHLVAAGRKPGHVGLLRQGR